MRAVNRLVLTTCILASSLSFVDGSVMNVGLPAIGRAMHASGSDLQWVINIYLLPLSALLLLGGGAGDRYGRRRLLVLGTSLFAVASVGCALAPSLAWLLIGRCLQGVGAAALMPNSLAILAATFSGEARGRAIGIWASAGALMAAVGPLLGGVLIDAADWRMIFLINIPLALGAIVLALRFVNENRDDRSLPLDMPGGLVATLGLAALTWGLTIGSGKDGWNGAAIALFIAGILLLIAFVGIEKIRGERAMMPLKMFGSASFTGLTVLTLLLYGALGALLVLIPYLLIQSGGYSSTEAGAALVPVALILTILSPTMGSIAGRIGPRLPLTFGPLVVGAGFLLALRIDGTGSYWTKVLPALIVISVGMTGAVAPLTNAVLASVDSRHTGSASGFNSAIARTGGLMATAMLGHVLGVTGASLLGGFQGAVLACAIASAAAGMCAFMLVRGRRT